MAWTATVSLDKDKTDIGSASVTWDKDGADEFTYTERTDVSQVAEFKVRAIAALDEILIRRVNQQARAGQLATIMNT